jgi:hypothetical protein
MRSLVFFIDLIFWPLNGPGLDSASNTNEYQESFLGDKGGRCVGLTTLPPSCVDCLEILGASTSWTLKGLYILHSLYTGWYRQSGFHSLQETFSYSPPRYSVLQHSDSYFLGLTRPKYDWWSRSKGDNAWRFNLQPPASLHGLTLNPLDSWWLLYVPPCLMTYNSGIQPEVRVPSGVHEDMLGVRKLKKKYKTSSIISLTAQNHTNLFIKYLII